MIKDIRSPLYTWDGGPKLSGDTLPMHLQPVELKQILLPVSSEIKLRSLPDEMLKKIFEAVLEGSVNLAGDLCKLAKVCEEWRLLILNAPSLWTHIDLFNCPLTKENIKALDKILEIIPGGIKNVEEVTIGARFPIMIDESIIPLFKKLIAAPKLNTLAFNDWSSPFSIPFTKWFPKALNECKKLTHFSMQQSEKIFYHDELFEDFLKKRGKQLEMLSVQSRRQSYGPRITEFIESSLCSNLKVLNLTYCPAIELFSLDAASLAENIPLLEVLHIGGLQLKMMSRPIKRYKLKHLKELSGWLDNDQIMSIAGRVRIDNNAAIETLTFGSTKILVLNMRGFFMSPETLLKIPSKNVRELHLEDIVETECSGLCKVISRWSHSLELISLNQAEDSRSIRRYLETMYNTGCVSRLKEVHFTGSDIMPQDLIEFMKRAHSLEYIAVSHCKLLHTLIKEPDGPGYWTADAIRECIKRRLK